MPILKLISFEADSLDTGSGFRALAFQSEAAADALGALWFGWGKDDKNTKTRFVGMHASYCVIFLKKNITEIPL